MAKLGTGLRPDLRPSRDLQKTLTQPLHAQMKDWLWRNADEPTRQRLNLLKTPHATAWLSCRELLKTLSQGEFVGGLTWVSGLKNPRRTVDLSRLQARSRRVRVHAVTCQRSGFKRPFCATLLLSFSPEPGSPQHQSNGCQIRSSGQPTFWSLRGAETRSRWILQ